MAAFPTAKGVGNLSMWRLYLYFDINYDESAELGGGKGQYTRQRIRCKLILSSLQTYCLSRSVISTAPPWYETPSSLPHFIKASTGTG